jgi:hypothetical protein
LTRGKSAKKASTITTDKGRIERHIKPLLGSIKVAAVSLLLSFCSAYSLATEVQKVRSRVERLVVAELNYRCRQLSEPYPAGTSAEQVTRT